MTLEAWQLRQRQSLPLECKIERTKLRIREWYEHWQGDVYVSFSGGKDSTALLHLVRSLYPEVPAVFCNTGLEYPEIVRFVRQTENVTWIRPKMRFQDVLTKYGYPLVSKEQIERIRYLRQGTTAKYRHDILHGDRKGRMGVASRWLFLVNAPFKVSEQCCDVMKKRPMTRFEDETSLHPIIGTMASDSVRRQTTYLQQGGCNAFERARPTINPLSIWLERDVWGYIHQFNVPYSTIYDMGYTRTGCMFCAFGAHLNSPNRFQLMARTHPKLYRYCMETLGMREVLKYAGIPYEPSRQLVLPICDSNPVERAVI